MRKWIKSLMLLVAFLLVGILAVIYGGFRMFRGSPSWYHHSALSAAEREVLARSAFNKFADIQNAAALVRQNEITDQRGDRASTANPIAVSFSDDELNAFFEKWANYANWKSNYDRYVEDPIVIVDKGHLILAGKVKDLDAVLSLEFDPRIDADGQLDLHLNRVLAGRLTIPESIARSYGDRLTASLKQNLPRWREHAAIDGNGAANSDLISASSARLGIHAMDRTPADAVLFLPLAERHANVPVRITSVQIQNHDVVMTVFPLTAAERTSLVSRIRADEPAPAH